MTKQETSAAVGFIAILPAALLVTMGLSGMEPFKILDSPFVILGGLGVALILNLPLVADFDSFVEKGNFVGSLTLRLKDNLPNLGAVVLSLALFGIIMLYLFLENFQPR